MNSERVRHATVTRPAEAGSDAHALALLVICQLTIAVAAYWRYISGAFLFIFTDIGSDTYTMFYPFMVHIGRYIRLWGLPTWSFSQGMGQNIFPAGLSNPFQALLYLLGPDSVAWGIVYVEILKIIAGGMFFFGYLRLIGASRYASIIGALCFSFSGYMIVGGTWYGHAAAMVFGALYLLAFELLRARITPLAFPIAVFFLGGHSTFYLVQFSVLLGAYALVRHIADFGFAHWRRLATLAGRMAMYGALGALCAAWFMTSDILRMIDSPRVAGEAGSFGALSGRNPLWPASLMQLATAIFRLYASDMLGAGSDFHGWYNYLEAPLFYSGLITLCAAPLAFARSGRGFRYAWGGWILFLALATLFPYLRHALYFFSGDYYKGGMSFIVPATLIPLGALGLDSAARGAGNRAIWPVVTLILLGALYGPWGTASAAVNPHVQSLCAALIVLYALALWLMSRKPDGVARIALLALVCIECAMLSYISVNKRDALSAQRLNSRSGYRDETIEAVAFLRARDSSFFRISKDYASGIARHTSFNDALVQDYYGTPSYSSFNQRYYIRFLDVMGIIDGANETQTRWARGIEDRPLLQALTSVDYVLSRQSDAALTAAGFVPLAHIGEITVLRNPLALPLGCAYQKCMTFSDFAALSPKAKSAALFDCCVIEDADSAALRDLPRASPHWQPPPLSALPELARRKRASAMRLSSHSPKKIRGSILTRTNSMLFLSIPFDRGWRATVDGVAAPLYLVNAGFAGLALGPGAHEIELRYRPPLFRISALLSVAGALGLICIAVRPRQKKALPASIQGRRRTERATARS